ncbi:hypothetical protein NDU88_005827 [Pleurodeles waltl]|uniref:Uncharacterized protein n=1 Tax=Pleurodeles waltl TaxID=8319 RepID=A0AAV7RM47_PLEWA|nr:hypothetical protein NDU88_005827 [Pleurodeles waltl]
MVQVKVDIVIAKTGTKTVMRNMAQLKSYKPRRDPAAEELTLASEMIDTVFLTLQPLKAQVQKARPVQLPMIALHGQSQDTSMTESEGSESDSRNSQQESAIPEPEWADFRVPAGSPGRRGRDWRSLGTRISGFPRECKETMDYAQHVLQERKTLEETRKETEKETGKENKEHPRRNRRRLVLRTLQRTERLQKDANSATSQEGRG